MPRKESEAVPEGNGPTPQDADKRVTWEVLQQAVLEMWGKMFGEHREDLRSMDHRLAGLEYDARQPRSAMKTDGLADTKTRECTEGAATAVQAMHGDSFSANRVQAGPKTTSTSFGVKAESPALSCRDNV